MVISMDRWKGKVAVVTGASAGIGAAISQQLVQSGLTVVGLARRKEKLEELAKQFKGEGGGKFHPLKCDVTKEEEILEAFKWIKDHLGPIHVLVNNAGIVRSKGLIDGDTEKWQEIFNTNVLGLCIATREAIKEMRANNIDGHVIHINSIAGHSVPNFPGINVYSASKFAVTALTETLRQELNSIGSKIKITSVSPGGVQTEIIEASGATLTPEMVELFKTIPMLKSEDVADAVCYVLATPHHVQIHELTIKPVGEQF